MMGCFHLVIERLLISGSVMLASYAFACFEFQSRYRAASHFRYAMFAAVAGPSSVSISLSSGFSFQAPEDSKLADEILSFHLVIERLLISGHDFNIVPTEAYLVSISLSSGFSFQA